MCRFLRKSGCGYWRVYWKCDHGESHTERYPEVSLAESTYGPADAKTLAHKLHEYCSSNSPNKHTAMEELKQIEFDLKERKNVESCEMDPGIYATHCAVQAGLHPATQRLLMHAVVDHLRPEGPLTYRISHREDARILFDAIDRMRTVLGMVEEQWVLWIFYLHLISRKTALEVAFKHVKVRCTKTAVKKVLQYVKKECSPDETMWDTRRPTGGVDRALEVVEEHSKLQSCAAKIAKLDWASWRPHRLNSLLANELPLLGYDGYHRGKTLRFLSDAAQHVSGKMVVWQRQDWEIMIQMLPGSNDVAKNFGLHTYEQACAGASYVDAMLKSLSPSADWPPMSLSDISCGLCLESQADMPHKDDDKYVKRAKH